MQKPDRMGFMWETGAGGKARKPQFSPSEGAHGGENGTQVKFLAEIATFMCLPICNLSYIWVRMSARTA